MSLIVKSQENRIESVTRLGLMETLDRDKVKYVYDVTMMMNTCKGAPGRITDALMGRKMVADLYIRRFHTTDIPKVRASGFSRCLPKTIPKPNLIVILNNLIWFYFRSQRRPRSSWWS